MGTHEIIKEIERLPMSKKILVIERTLKSMRENDIQNQNKLPASEGKRIKLSSLKGKLSKMSAKETDDKLKSLRNEWERVF